MSSTPTLDELKEACGSQKVQDALRMFFLFEEADYEGLIMVLNEKSDDARARIGKKRALLQEVGNLNSSDSVVANGTQCLQQAQSKDFQLLSALVVVIDLLIEARVEKRQHVIKMSEYD